MNIILVGLGKVGRKIKEICQKENIPIKALVSPNNPNATHKKLFEVDDIASTDIIIDFSHCSAVLDHTKIAIQSGCNIVMGTAGWEDQKEEVKHLVNTSHIGFVFAHNFMKSTNDFWNTIRCATEEIKKNNYIASVKEKRVRNASKAYSSTAFHTTAIIANALGKKAKIANFSQQKQDPDYIFLETTPNGENPLDICVSFKTEVTTLCFQFLVKNADKSNEEYAKGALQAANYIHEKKGFFEYSFFS